MSKTFVVLAPIRICDLGGFAPHLLAHSAKIQSPGAGEDIGEDGQAGEGTKVGALYAKIKAKVGADTAKLALAEAINGSLIDNINRATTSDAVLDVYEAMCESFLADVFGQARDTATYATAEAQLEAYLA